MATYLSMYMVHKCFSAKSTQVWGVHAGLTQMYLHDRKVYCVDIVATSWLPRHLHNTLLNSTLFPNYIEEKLRLSNKIDEGSHYQAITTEDNQ